jgi:phosphate transport system substrate-binding protein
VRIAGSTSIQPLAEVLAEGYGRQGGGRVTIQGGGSTAGLQALQNGVATLGATSRRLTADESARGLVPHIIGYDVLTVVVHPSNPVDGLTRGELRLLFAGEVDRWGGELGRVHLVSREAGSGSREAFRTMVGAISAKAIIQNSSGASRVAVMNDPQAVGYVSLGAALQGGVKALRIDGRAPGQSGYPLVRPLSLVTLGEPSGEVAAFLRFALSPAGQRLVREEGLVPVHE